MKCYCYGDHFFLTTFSINILNIKYDIFLDFLLIIASIIIFHHNDGCNKNNFRTISNVYVYLFKGSSLHFDKFVFAHFILKFYSFFVIGTVVVYYKIYRTPYSAIKVQNSLRFFIPQIGGVKDQNDKFV